MPLEDVVAWALAIVASVLFVAGSVCRFLQVRREVRELEAVIRGLCRRESFLDDEIRKLKAELDEAQRRRGSGVI